MGWLSVLAAQRPRRRANDCVARTGCCMSFLTVLDAAVAGTQRHPDGASEDSLLCDAAFEGMRRLAGRQLDRIGAPPLPSCPPETRSEVPPAARARLLELLDERNELML